MIEIGAYLPDLPAFGVHATIAHNCVPAIGYYSPVYSGVRYGDAFGETVLSAYATRNAQGTPYNFAGSDAYLKLVQSAAWTDVSKAGGYNTADGNWDWVTFGNRVIATNGVEKPQSYVMGSSTDFADLTADDIIAATVGVIKGFVMFGNTTESAVNYRNRVKWSALEDPTDYTVDPDGTQSDYQDLFGENDVGKVIKVVGGEVATIFCERGIFRGTYVGGDLIFTFDQIVKHIGTRSMGSVVAFGDIIFFLGNDGFYMMSGAQLVPIGEGQINRTFLSEVYQSDISRISATIDPYRSLYIVAYPTDSSGKLNKKLIYNWVSKRWTTADTDDAVCLFTFMSESWTVDGSSSAIGDIDLGAYADVPVDSPMFIGGEPNNAAVDDDGYVIIYNGAAKDAIVETAEHQLYKGAKALIQNITPMIEGSNSEIYVSVGYRNTPQEAVSYTSESLTNSNGEANLFNIGRYQRAKLRVSGGFAKVYGVDWQARQAGKY